MGVFRHWASDVWLWVLEVLNSGLKLSPIVVEMTGESAIWMGILWHWASNIGLRVLKVLNSGLNLGPVIVEMAGESRIWMGVSWVSSSNIWLWILLKLMRIGNSEECSDGNRHLFHFDK